MRATKHTTPSSFGPLTALGAALVTAVFACGVRDDAAADVETPTPFEPTATPDGGGAGPEAGAAADARADAAAPPCGGPAPATPRCAAHLPCASGTDCASGLCGAAGPANKRCLSAPSCTGTPGTFGCGAASNEDCCSSLPVPGGTYNRHRDPAYPATVSKFRLDKYEITVGRMRAYFDAVGGNPKGNPPAPGAAAHPKVTNSGWRSSFNIRLPASRTEIDDRLTWACHSGGNNTDGGAATWTHAPGPYEDLPITCIDWYTLFAFCAWDGGRLPTDAEWGFAGEGGSEQREYAWGGVAGDKLVWPTDNALASLGLFDPLAGVDKFTTGTPFRTTDPVTGRVNDGPAHMSVPGHKSGTARWGHADLTGNVLEYLLDQTPTIEGGCADCANVAWPDPPQDQVGFYPESWNVGPDDGALSTDSGRVLRGGSWDPTHVQQVYYHYQYPIYRTYYAAGGRCARD